MSDKATDNLGSHLLGRKVEEDSRDYDMGEALEKLQAKSDDPILDKTLRQAASDGDPLVTSWKGFLKLWQILKAFIHGSKPTPTPVPVPDPTPVPTPVPTPPVPPSPPTAVTKKLWSNPHAVLDQGQTGHCVGFGWAQFGNTDPINDNYGNADGDKIYYEAKVIDGEPKAEDGSTVRSGAKALQNRKRIANYVFASSLGQIKTWVLTQGPVTVGTSWLNDMFEPDADGYVHPTGPVEGGHCYTIVGYDTATDVFTLINSWGSSWAKNGYFYMHASEWDKLFADQGEACGCTELPL